MKYFFFSPMLIFLSIGVSVFAQNVAQKIYQTEPFSPEFILYEIDLNTKNSFERKNYTHFNDAFNISSGSALELEDVQGNDIITLFNYALLDATRTQVPSNTQLFGSVGNLRFADRALYHQPHGQDSILYIITALGTGGGDLLEHIAVRFNFRLNGGLGDIDTSFRLVMETEPNPKYFVGGSMSLISHCNQRDNWWVFPRRSSNGELEIAVHLLDTVVHKTPSSVFSVTDYVNDFNDRPVVDFKIVANPIGNKLVFHSVGFNENSIYEADFNASTGVIGDVKKLYTITNKGSASSLTYSPNGNMLYITLPPKFGSGVFDTLNQLVLSCDGGIGDSIHTLSSDSFRIRGDNNAYLTLCFRNKFFFDNGNGGMGLIHSPNVFGKEAFIDKEFVKINEFYRARDSRYNNSLYHYHNDILVSGNILSQQQRYCEGDTLSLSMDIPCAMEDFRWQLESNSGITTLKDSALSYALQDTGWHQILFIGNLPCYTDTTFLEVYAHPKPLADLGPDTSYCFGDSVSFSFSDSSINRWVWNGELLGADYTAAVPTTLVLSVTDTNGCMNIDTVALGERPPFEVDAGEAQLYCPDSLLVLSASPGANYEWVPANGVSMPTARETSVMVAANTVFTVTVSDSFGCKGMDSVLVFTEGLGEKRYQADEIVCEGGVASILAQGGLSYHWTSDKNEIDCTDCATTFTKVNVTASYSVDITSGCGTETFEFTIVVDSTIHPTANYTGHVVVAPDDTANLSIDFTGQVMWMPSNLVGCSTCNPTTAQIKQPTTFTITIIDDDGCVHVFEQFIDIVDPCVIIKIPNAFTPTADGLNEALEVYFPTNTEEQVLLFQIYNRWGKLVYEVEAPEVPKWNGMQDNTPLPSGAYTWRMLSECRGKSRSSNGQIVLIR